MALIIHKFKSRKIKTSPCSDKYHFTPHGDQDSWGIAMNKNGTQHENIRVRNLAVVCRVDGDRVEDILERLSNDPDVLKIVYVRNSAGYLTVVPGAV